MVDITKQAMLSRAISSATPANSTNTKNITGANTNVQSTAFKDLLQTKIDSANTTIEFSKHAQQRLEERGIDLSDNLLTSLSDSVAKASEKGAKNILAMSEQSAFIINVPTNKVITAMNQSEMKQNIFTNIDSAVIL